MTLFVRGPRRKRLSNADVELMPPRDTWPAAAEPGGEAVESTPATLDEYHRMRSYLLQRRLIN
ncbi:hypothetical protein [Streptomyces sp. NPDC005969]|uniref:hypothetical protein n=1 Tax=Streptomyces sp. NPDC005969 TaxID=3156722 RepID=UPI0033C0DE07